MADYVSNLDSERAPRIRVGTAISKNQTLDTSHPMYKALTSQMQNKLSELLARETEKKRAAAQAIVTAALPAEERAMITGEYPEFNIVWATLENPVHSYWHAQRQLVNQVMLHQSMAYAEDVAHYGGSALGALSRGHRNVTMYVDTCDAVAVHESHQDDVMCSRLLSSSASANDTIGWRVDAKLREDYLASRCLLKRGAGDYKGGYAEALIVDGSLYPMPALQFASAMNEIGSTVGFFSLPYHPSILISPTGELPGTGVQYALTNDRLHLTYPEGVAGVNNYPAGVWHQWLLNTVRELRGTKNFYQYELYGTRGPFMIVRVVCIGDTAPAVNKVVHSLQLRYSEPMAIVRTMRLRSLLHSPHLRTSWQDAEAVVPQRVLNKLHDFAMGLPNNDFSRFSIRKRVKTINNRTVVQGTSVQVNEPLTANQLDVLENAIFVHCFVARYNAGRLSQQMQKLVDRLAVFGLQGTMSKLGSVIVAAGILVYDWTIAVVEDALRAICDRIVEWVRGDIKNTSASFVVAPAFVRLEHYIGATASPFWSAMSRLSQLLPTKDDILKSFAGARYILFASEMATDDSVVSEGEEYNVPHYVGEQFEDLVDTREPGGVSEQGHQLYSVVRSLNVVDEPDLDRHVMRRVVYDTTSAPIDLVNDDYTVDPGYITTLNEMHEAAFPGLETTNFMYDQYSISMDDQDRTLSALRLVLPLEFGSAPANREIYPSNLTGYSVTKRASTIPETLSAAAARNLADPVLALPQDDDDLLRRVFEDFLDIACVPEARSMLAIYQTDPVALEQDSFYDWTKKAKPETVAKLLRYYADNPLAIEQMAIHMYSMMIKSDVKPPLSLKPLFSRIEPQMIVYHSAEINSIYSSIYRVLVRRLLSLLKPNFMLNLLKDMDGVRDMMQTSHDWNAKDLNYLECDFSKYDKSQGQFALKLECYVYERLGMNKEMLARWQLGHVDCSIKDMTSMMGLSVRFQRKSGDATTAFGNGLINMMTVLHVYRGTDIVWAVFMGDDSLVCARQVVGSAEAVAAFAEKFNLPAKFYTKGAPYFASSFVLVQQGDRRIVCVPDPIKRVERWAMAVSAHDPKWDEKYTSAVDKLRVYRNRANVQGLDGAIRDRYTVGDYNTSAVVDAVATAISTPERFRALWDTNVQSIIC